MCCTHCTPQETRHANCRDIPSRQPGYTFYLPDNRADGANLTTNSGNASSIPPVDPEPPAAAEALPLLPLEPSQPSQPSSELPPPYDTITSTNTVSESPSSSPPSSSQSTKKTISDLETSKDTSKRELRIREYAQERAKLAREVRQSWQKEWDDKFSAIVDKYFEEDLVQKRSDRDAWPTRAQRSRLGPRLGRVWYRNFWLPYTRFKHYNSESWYLVGERVKLELEMLARYREKYDPLIKELEERYYPETQGIGRIPITVSNHASRLMVCGVTSKNGIRNL